MLGPLAVEADGTSIPIGRGKRAALLVALLLEANRVVPTDRLLDELWHGQPPRTAPAALQNYVSQLRSLLHPSGVLLTHAAGYELRVPAGAVDAQRFEQLVAEARNAAAARRPADALRLLRAALALWRGPPLADVAFEPFAAVEARRLDELRLAAIEDRIDAELALGAREEVVAELRALAAEHPLRERLRAQLMLALYRVGRQAAALEVYRDARRTLVEQLGVEPGPDLRALERAILVQDPALEPLPRAPAARLPAPPTTLVGRAAEVAVVVALLGRARLVTLTGPGGIGKTRLALEAARVAAEHYAGGAAFVGLATVTDAGRVPAAVADGLCLDFGPEGVTPAALVEALAGESRLLVVDNAEHLPAAAPLLGELLAGCPGLSLLVTSRSPVRVAGEQQFAVPPLELPAPHAAAAMPVARLAEAEAVALFTERARAVDHDFVLGEDNAAAVVELCRRLDALPLAIELAAGWTKVLPPARLAERLDRRLDLLARGPADRPPRQRSLRAAMDWSHELLDGPVRDLFARLAVFEGGWDLDAAEAVGGGAPALTALAELADAGLVVRRAGAGGAPRFAMLETVREYALERLDAAGVREDARARHTAWAAALAEGIAPALVGPDQEHGLARLDAERANLRAALSWALAADPAVALRLTGAAWRLWHVRGPLDEGLRAVRAALARAPAQTPPTRARADSALGGGVLAYLLGETDTAQALWREAARLHGERGDAAGVAFALGNLGMVAHYRGELDAAQALYDQALATARDGGSRAVAVTLLNQASLAKDRGRLAEAKALLARALTCFEAHGDERSVAATRDDLAAVAIAEGDHDRAVVLCEESLAIVRRLGDATAAIETLQHLATALGARGDAERARQVLDEVLERSRDARDPWGEAFALDGLAALALEDGDPPRALCLAERALALHRRVGNAAGVEASLRTVAASSGVPSKLI